MKIQKNLSLVSEDVVVKFVSLQETPRFVAAPGLPSRRGFGDDDAGRQTSSPPAREDEGTLRVAVREAFGRGRTMTTVLEVP